VRPVNSWVAGSESGIPLGIVRTPGRQPQLRPGVGGYRALYSAPVVDFPPCDDVCGALEEHVRRFFRGRDIKALTWRGGPILEANPHFRVLQIAPTGPGGVWHYASVGGWAATPDSDHGLEFIVSTPMETVRAVELLAWNVYYHRGGRLGLGHSVPIGEPWLPGSRCDHWLVSLPYPFGPELQQCHVGDRHVDFLWLVPITKAE
jgi:Suppressor of fused protein (SUFU)